MLTFVRIVEMRTLSAAAISLKTTQPTVSRRLKALEGALGVKLIHRTTHQQTITDEGKAFYSHAKDILLRWEIAESEIKGHRETPSGLLRVQVPHALGQDHLLPVVDSYLKKFKDMRVDWILKDQMPDFLSQNVDCAIHVGYVEEPSLVAIKLFEIPRILVASPHAFKNHKKLDHPEKLKTLPWLSLKNFYINELTFKNKVSGETSTIAFEPVFSTDNLYALKNMTILGHGISVISAWAAEQELKAARLVQICQAWRAPSFSVYLTYPQSKYKPAKLTQFIEELKKANFI